MIRSLFVGQVATVAVGHLAARRTNRGYDNKQMQIIAEEAAGAHWDQHNAAHPEECEEGAETSLNPEVFAVDFLDAYLAHLDSFPAAFGGSYSPA